MRLIKAFFFIILLGTAFFGGLVARGVHDEFAKNSHDSEEFVGQLSSSLPLPPSSVPHASTLLFVGDVMLSRGVDYYVHKFGGGDFTYPFLNIADTLRSADLTFGNLEGPMSSRGKNQGSVYSFRADPKAVEGLTNAGFDIMSVANNHIWDYGRDALEDTVSILKTNRILPVGAGKDYKEANDPVFAYVGPSTGSGQADTRIAFFAFTNLMPRSLEATGSHSGLSQFDLELVKKAILNVQNQADLVVVSMHWGSEYETRANQSQKLIARQLIDAGADLVIGHHPHVVEEVEAYRQGWIAFSLGNFVFDQQFSDETSNGLMLKVEVAQGKIVNVEKIGIRINKTAQPEVVQ